MINTILGIIFEYSISSSCVYFCGVVVDLKKGVGTEYSFFLSVSVYDLEMSEEMPGEEILGLHESFILLLLCFCVLAISLFFPFSAF